MADIHLTVDGVAITVPKGTNIVDAARTADIAIPVFCYHPRMQAVGMCRMCLVSVGTPRIDRATGQPVLDEAGKPVIGMMPKLQTACTTAVVEGMVVYTQTDEVKFAQKGILEFLLTSHPLDCPVCDKGGECPLQNLTMGWGPGESRFDYTDKAHFEKPIPLGDLIYLDRERCILCGRCVRYEDEIADDPVLGYSSRGRAWHIISKSDPPFDSKFSGNTTDICPVGALTTADFRFQARAWELTSVPAVCTHCPVGCNISLDMRHNKIMRVMPRENGAVNDIWICDKGRFAQHYVESTERLETPLVRRGDTLVSASWDEAQREIARRLGSIERTAGGEALAGLASTRLSNEDLYLFQKFFREVLGSHNLDHRIGTPGEFAADDAAVRLGVGTGTNLMELGQGTTVLVIGADPEEEAPLYLLRLRAIAERGGTLIVANARPTKLERSATRRLAYAPGGAVAVVRALLRAALEEAGTPETTLQRLHGLDDLRAALANTSLEAAAAAAGLQQEELRAAAHSFVQAEHGIIVYGSEALAYGPVLARDLGTLALLAGKFGRANSGLIALLPGGNSRGALDMGVRPDCGPGCQPLDAPGLSAREMWGAALEERLQGMYIVGLDPARDYPATRAALEKLELLVVQDMFLTETAKLADVVLPTQTFAERDGTYTNAERRVQRSRQARPEPGQARSDWQIIQGIAQAWYWLAGANSATPEGWDYLTVGELAGEIAEQVPGYAGITHTSLARTGQRGTWGRQTNEAIYYDGTNYENTEGVGIQYPALAEHPDTTFDVSPLHADTPTPDERYPFLLLTQPLLYDGDPLLRDSRLLAHVPVAAVALSRSDAERLDIRQGTQVWVSSAAGSLKLPARVLPDVTPGSVIIPAHLPDAPLAEIETGPQTRVAIGKAEA